MITIAVYDTKPYDREYLTQAPGAERVAWRFHEFRLSAETAPAAKGEQAVCIFVNTQADRACLEIHAERELRDERETVIVEGAVGPSAHGLRHVE